MTSKTYLLDSNIFMEASRTYYRFHIVPTFWDVIIDGHNDNTLYSIDKVKEEIKAGNDDLATWVSDTLPDEFFNSIVDMDVITDTRKWFNG
ncbi:MAG: hypothetical protein CME31_22880 [Gimesia sp.]|uniref:DUF4411 domain-containing protein n=1 Tax=Gimesia maris TaxID=122 RepID=A0A3D3R2W2_9PLAN|nr:hypothetical protein [Gimesia sp.]HCO22926.1 hypothetical protein [Gimesia maris]|tara:strand:+ start:12713 stop:12985 length:273 start_codon:yes stop_codon:yes gene_type:complete